MTMHFASKNNSGIDFIFDGSFIQVYLLGLDHQPGTLMYSLSFSPWAKFRWALLTCFVCISFYAAFIINTHDC